MIPIWIDFEAVSLVELTSMFVAMFTIFMVQFTAAGHRA